MRRYRLFFIMKDEEEEINDDKTLVISLLPPSHPSNDDVTDSEECEVRPIKDNWGMMSVTGDMTMDEIYMEMQKMRMEVRNNVRYVYRFL